MVTEIFVALALLFFKHWYVDFVDQNDEEVKHKGIYGDFIGMGHSIKHGAATMLVFLIVDPFHVSVLLLGLIDAVAHYHIDWIKMKFGNRDVKTRAFWAQLGLDQLAHYMTYLFLVWLIV
jgi:hypothetical protein